jgi:hypothetical protein
MKILFRTNKYKRYRNRFPNFNNWKKWGLGNNFLKSLLKSE